MASNLPKYTLRIPRELLEKIKYAAEFEGRSANKQIEFLIKKYIAEFESKHGEIQITD